MFPSHDPAMSLQKDSNRPREATVIRDIQACLPLSRVLRERDLVLLLTPVVAPFEPGEISHAVTSDPFEPLGKALERYHPWIRHVPYTVRSGISSTHAAFIKRAAVVIFVISGPPAEGQPSQIIMSEVVRSIAEQRPQIVIACCDVQELNLTEITHPTVIKLLTFSAHALESAADLMFQEAAAPRSVVDARTGAADASSLPWFVEEWNASRDLVAVHDLWLKCLPAQFKLDLPVLRSLLVREGYSRHYVVREPGTEAVIGFCATYTTYFDKGRKVLVGSLSIVVVRESSRRQGVGSSLHEYALKQLSGTRGVCRLQLGSTFPRLLYGLPLGIPFEDWFFQRGWHIDGQDDMGCGREVCDWLLEVGSRVVKDTPSPPRLTFRICRASDFDAVLEVIGTEVSRGQKAAWYHQYAKLAGSERVQDTIIGLDNGVTVAVALTYTSDSKNSIAEDLPWARSISADTGGVTCICISESKAPSMESREAILTGLLNACIDSLSRRGMKGIFLDIFQGGDAVLESLGFQKWARYRELWKDV